MITVGSLFAGIGGLEKGLEDTGGFVTKWQVERDDYALKVLEKHWPDVTRHTDVRTFPPPPTSPWLMHDWKAKWGVDLICGGFPCQDISYAGKGAGLAGSRSGLFYEVIRVARLLRPRWLLLENVAALLSRGLGTVLKELSEIGYVGEWHCIPAAAVGAPHIRDRVFILAHTASDGLDDGTDYVKGESATPRDQGSPQQPIVGRERATKGLGGGVPNGPTVRGYTPTLSGSGWPADTGILRVDDGIPNQPHRIRCLGNAVVPQVAEYIGRQILKGNQ